MTTIILNGQQTKIDDTCTIVQLLHDLDLTEKRLAVEINQEIIPRSEFSTYQLNEQDKVEIVQAIGGGC
jgi:sulfur carrier protein